MILQASGGRRKGLRAPHRRSGGWPTQTKHRSRRRRARLFFTTDLPPRRFLWHSSRIDSLQLLNLQMRSPLLDAHARVLLPFSQQSRRPSLFIALATAIASAGSAAPSAQAASRIHYADSAAVSAATCRLCEKTFNTKLQPYTAKSYPTTALTIHERSRPKGARALHHAHVPVRHGAERTAAAVSKAHLMPLSST